MKAIHLVLLANFLAGCQTASNSSPADKLVELCEELRSEGHFEIPKEFGCKKEDLEIFEEHYGELPEDLVDFLCGFLPKGDLDISLLKTTHPVALLEEQTNFVPFEGNIKHRLFGLGWWIGEQDGDGWFYDLETGKIYAIDIYSNDLPTRDQTLSAAYKSFENLDEWVGFLSQQFE